MGGSKADGAGREGGAAGWAGDPLDPRWLGTPEGVWVGSECVVRAQRKDLGWSPHDLSALGCQSGEQRAEGSERGQARTGVSLGQCVWGHTAPHPRRTGCLGWDVGLRGWSDTLGTGARLGMGETPTVQGRGSFGTQGCIRGPASQPGPAVPQVTVAQLQVTEITPTSPREDGCWHPTGERGVPLPPSCRLLGRVGAPESRGNSPHGPSWGLACSLTAGAQSP